MLRIRFFRTGRKKQPFYKIVVTDKNNPPASGRFVEDVGFYNPFTKECDIKKERVLHWIGKGAQPSDVVHNLLVKKEVISGEKVNVVSITNKRKEKIAEKEEQNKQETEKKTEETLEKTEETQEEEESTTKEDTQEKEEMSADKEDESKEEEKEEGAKSAEKKEVTEEVKEKEDSSEKEE